MSAAEQDMTEMQMTTYFQKLKDPRWQKKRLEVLAKNEWRCERCMDGDNTLHVHHRQYFKGREPWDYEPGQLAVLCENCHAVTHEGEDKLQLVCSFVESEGPKSRDIVASLVAGFIGKADDNELMADPHTFQAGMLSFELSGLAFAGLAVYELQMLAGMAKSDPQSVISAIRSLLGTSAPKGFDA